MDDQPCIRPGSQVFIRRFPDRGVGVVRTVFTTEVDGIGEVEKCLVNFPHRYWEHWFLADELEPLSGCCAACGEPHIDWQILPWAGGLSFYYKCPHCAYTSPGRPSAAESLEAAVYALHGREKVNHG